MVLAMLQEDHLRDLGYESLKATRVATALLIADQAPLDAAILDENLAGEPSYPRCCTAARMSLQRLSMASPQRYPQLIIQAPVSFALRAENFCLLPV
jgi:hypothetical protein